MHLNNLTALSCWLKLLFEQSSVVFLNAPATWMKNSTSCSTEASVLMYSSKSSAFPFLPVCQGATWVKVKKLEIPTEVPFSDETD